MYCCTTSTQVVAPDRMARGRSSMVPSSTRKEPPVTSSVIAVLLARRVGILERPHGVRGVLNGPQNTPVAAAPAEVALQCCRDCEAIRTRIVAQQSTGGDEDPGGAVAALGRL